MEQNLLFRIQTRLHATKYIPRRPNPEPPLRILARIEASAIQGLARIENKLEGTLDEEDSEDSCVAMRHFLAHCEGYALPVVSTTNAPGRILVPLKEGQNSPDGWSCSPMLRQLQQGSPWSPHRLLCNNLAGPRTESQRSR